MYTALRKKRGESELEKKNGNILIFSGFLGLPYFPNALRLGGASGGVVLGVFYRGVKSLY